MYLQVDIAQEAIRGQPLQPGAALTLSALGPRLRAGDEFCKRAMGCTGLAILHCCAASLAFPCSGWRMRRWEGLLWPSFPGGGFRLMLNQHDAMAQ